MHRLQSGELLHPQKQKTGGTEAGVQEVLQMVQKTHRS